MSQQQKSFLYTITAVFFWSTAATAFKIALKEFNSNQLLFISSFTSFLIFLFVALFNNKAGLLESFQLKYLTKNLLIGLFNPFLYYIILFNAYSILPAQEALILNFTWPVTVSIFAIIFLKSKFSLKTLLGIITSFFGVLIIATKGQLLSLKFENPFGVLLAVGSSLIWASYWIFNLKDKRPATVKLFFAFFSGTIYTAIYIHFFDTFKFTWSAGLNSSIYIGFFEMGLTYLFWLKGISLSNNKPLTSTYAFLAPFLSLMFISILLNESITAASIFGLLFIFCGIIIQKYPDLRKYIKI
ncbi:MAG: DMT family transporter [Melioribacteraceae bacterium]|nr:DMT family transporter [Melioribacteraceae bacterium]